VETVNISTFKARCLELLRRVKETGQPILVTRRGEPIAQIDPPAPAPRPGSWLGAAKGSGEILGDVVSPLGPGAWEALDEKRNP
jgi:prevent-host-death family protein